jgi:hypothetical protein
MDPAAARCRRRRAHGSLRHRLAPLALFLVTSVLSAAASREKVSAIAAYGVAFLLAFAGHVAHLSGVPERGAMT